MSFLYKVLKIVICGYSSSIDAPVSCIAIKKSGRPHSGRPSNSVNDYFAYSILSATASNASSATNCSPQVKSLTLVRYSSS